MKFHHEARKPSMSSTLYFKIALLPKGAGFVSFILPVCLEFAPAARLADKNHRASAGYSAVPSLARYLPKKENAGNGPAFHPPIP
jgi:hypothetical protein